MTIYFSSDHHFNHVSILSHCQRPFSSVQEMDEELIKRWNSVIKENDEVYYLGDLTLGNWATAWSYIKRLKGRFKFIEGNHDVRWFSKLPSNQKLPPIYELKYNHSTFVLSHYPLRSWNKSFHSSYHLFGHCLDEDSEILTLNGWRRHNEIENEDLVCTLNLKSGLLEYQKIKNIIKQNYSGKIERIISKGLDINVTDQHVMIDYDKRKGTFSKFLAKDFKNKKRREFIKAGRAIKKGINISDDLLRLVVWISADGALYNKNLVRIKLQKDRKIKRIRELLDRLSLEYRFKEYVGKEYVSFNFNIPEEISFLSFKPLPEQLFDCTRNQLLVILDEYGQTDGSFYDDTLCIWTSKKEEADLIQRMCVTNGFQCNITTLENKGFSKKPNYTLFITNKWVRGVGDTEKALSEEMVLNKLYWCVQVENQTIMTRRNGKPVVVGNCHDNMPPYGKSFDIGVDCHDFYPLSINQVIEKMKDL